MGENNTIYTRRVGVTQTYSVLSNLRAISALPPDKFLEEAKKWTPETIEETVKSFPEYVARDRQTLYDALRNAYAILRNPVCETDDSLRLASIQNAQTTLALVVQNILNNRASEKAEKSLAMVAGEAQKRAHTLDLKAKEMYELAHTDNLTGCRNQRYFTEKYEAEIAEARNYNRPLSLIVLDIDRFKHINDDPVLGHKGGDYVLRELAQTASKIMIRPEADTFARYGGEEFVFLLPETDEQGALKLAEKVRGAIESHKFAYEGKEIPVTISAGVAQFSPADNVDLFTLADRCLYAAKESGRNRVMGASQLRSHVKTLPVGKDAIQKMFALNDSWFDYFSKQPSAPLKTSDTIKRVK
jgi:diguanylate cyclase (GGDEF)-like protein